MKKTKIYNLTLLSSLLLFSACASNQANVQKTSNNKQISVYKIMGISEPQQELVQFIVTGRDLSPTRTYEKTEPNISEDIEFISYRREPTHTPNYAPKHLQGQNINQVEANAKSFLGTPYVWGATGPRTFDCSGFTQWVYRDAGVKIPRVSRDQAKVGQYVRYEDLRRGDMVFFDTKKRRKGIVTHVGIYLGNHNFIHASSAGKKVVIYNFNEKKFYKERFLWGRRVLSDQAHYATN